MKKISIVFLAFLFTVSAMVFAQEEASEHPVPMDGKDCAVCHAPNSQDESAASPDAYTQWSSSMHSIVNVKCVTCHGDDKSFKAKSSINTCLSCHPSETTTINKKVIDHGEGLICSSCHAVHKFNVVKEDKPIHSK